jgi:hypothetical protein
VKVEESGLMLVDASQMPLSELQTRSHSKMEKGIGFCNCPQKAWTDILRKYISQGTTLLK